MSLLDDERDSGDFFDDFYDESDFIDDTEEDPDYDPNDLCPTCNGSGEGMWDGSTCTSCKGSGTIGGWPKTRR